VPDVERIVFGTVALGLPYGLSRDGTPPALMDGATAGALVRHAEKLGVRVFDTAPAYGASEARLGEAAGPAARIWTKVGRHSGIGPSLGDEVLAELALSKERLRRARIDLLQWHNWTRDLAENEHFRACWRRLAEHADGDVATLGASTYGADDAVAAVESGLFRVVQVEYNVLNQHVVERAGELAAKRGVKLAVRSVFLQGALTEEGRSLPALPSLENGVRRARELARAWGMPLTELALRAALGALGVSYVLVGIDRAEQLDEACRVARLGPLELEHRRELRRLDLSGDAAVDPRHW
jgi:aryl-alcohol dehydrogenase-like predicted oxidoreductase